MDVAKANGLHNLTDVVDHDKVPWCAHVTLGKIGVKSEQVGMLRLRNLSPPFKASGALVDSGLVHPKGLCLMGDQPKKVKLDWHLPFSLSPRDHSRRAREALAQRDPDRTLEHTSMVLRAEPSNASALASAGVAYARIGQRGDAIAHLRAALAIDVSGDDALEGVTRERCIMYLQQLESQEQREDEKSKRLQEQA